MKKFSTCILSMSNNVPDCRNCVHFIPSKYKFTTQFNQCKRFGKKYLISPVINFDKDTKQLEYDFITNKITYDFADSCRKNNDKCGLEAKYYEEIENPQKYPEKKIYDPIMFPFLCVITVFVCFII